MSVGPHTTRKLDVNACSAVAQACMGTGDHVRRQAVQPAPWIRGPR
ncbi:hypothetical protein [Streptomyces sp. MJM8645]|nr:hypothetical protein [Streptomyces sp. MJM8645]